MFNVLLFHVLQIRVITVPPSDREIAERMMSSHTKEMKWSVASYTPR